MLRTPKEKTIVEIYAEILDYCHQEDRGVRGYWGQEPYKQDFFEIFYAAHKNHHCGWSGKERYKRARKRRKTAPSMAAYVVSGNSIREYLDGKIKMTQRHKDTIDDLTTWWDNWTYAWDNHPVGVPRIYKHRRKHVTAADPSAEKRAKK